MVITNAPRGTNDFLPEDTAILQYVERTMARIAGAFGYDEMRCPIFEHTELFQRGIGDATDIVEKEMYTFTDRGDRSITLRPEGTAGVVRAYLERKLYALAQPVKLSYTGPMFRYERPQAGRFRQFHQLGLEAIGAADPMVDAEIVAICDAFYRELGLTSFVVHLNSIGCPQCRPGYIQALREYASSRLDALCSSCKVRYDKNALRLLDCKVEECRHLTESAPRTTDHLCSDCRGHFTKTKGYLESLGISYVLNHRLVRGLDYYTKTVFEFVLPGIGSQDAIGGGGRYDGLVEKCGGDPTPGVGVAIGIERIVLAMKATGDSLPAVPSAEVFIACLGGAAKLEGFRMAGAFRARGVRTELDYSAKGLKGQLKAADRSGARVCLVLGDDELARGLVVVRPMTGGQQTQEPIEGIVDRTIATISDIKGVQGE